MKTFSGSDLKVSLNGREIVGMAQPSFKSSGWDALWMAQARKDLEALLAGGARKVVNDAMDAVSEILKSGALGGVASEEYALWLEMAEEVVAGVRQ